jgi:thiamine-phosphate pyrophosphorylase
MQMTSKVLSKAVKQSIRGLYLVTDRELCLHHSLETVVNLSIRGGVSMIQLREKSANTREFLNLALAIKERLLNTNVPLIINDRVDIALAANADGVHLGQSDMPARVARQMLGNNSIIGLSVETEDDFLAIHTETNIDYIGVSPVFSTPTKTDTQKPWGLEGLRKLRTGTKLPLVAIGGINSTNAKEIISAGADSLAVVSYLCSAEDPELNARTLARLFL